MRSSSSRSSSVDRERRERRVGDALERLQPLSVGARRLLVGRGRFGMPAII